MKPTKAQLMTLYKTKGQGAFSPSSVFKLFGIEPPTESEVVEHIENEKRIKADKLSNSGVELKEDCQTAYRRKYDNAKDYRGKRSQGEMITGWCPSELVKDMYLVEKEKL